MKITTNIENIQVWFVILKANVIRARAIYAALRDISPSHEFLQSMTTSGPLLHTSAYALQSFSDHNLVRHI